MKKLLFRSTRGKAILTTFDLVVSEEDQVRGENFHQRLIGYVIMFESGPMRRIVDRVCQGFNLGEMRCNFEILPRNVQVELNQAVAAKN